MGCFIADRLCPNLFHRVGKCLSDGTVGVSPVQNRVIRALIGNLLGVARICQKEFFLLRDKKPGIFAGIMADILYIDRAADEHAIQVLFLHIRK